MFIYRFNGQAIRKAHATVRILLPTEQDVVMGLVAPEDIDRLSTVMVSDASEHKAFIYEADQIRVVHEFPFSLDERQQSSTFRELLAIHRLFSHSEKFLELNKGRSVAWLTDNQAVTSVVQRGSRVPQIQQLAMDITIAQVVNNIKILPVWQRRSTALLQIADDGSKSISTDEWSVSADQFNLICTKFNFVPEWDLMATAKNTKCPQFFSKLPEVGTSGVNVFLQNLSPGRKYYACPPVRSIVPLVHKILDQSDIVCLLLVPYWPSASYWPLFCELGHFRSFIKKLYIFQTSFTSESDNCIFKNSTNFSMAALLIST